MKLKTTIVRMSIITLFFILLTVLVLLVIKAYFVQYNDSLLCIYGWWACMGYDFLENKYLK